MTFLAKGYGHFVLHTPGFPPGLPKCYIRSEISCSCPVDRTHSRWRRHKRSTKTCSFARYNIITYIPGSSGYFLPHGNLSEIHALVASIQLIIIVTRFQSYLSTLIRLRPTTRQPGHVDKRGNSFW